MSAAKLPPRGLRFGATVEVPWQRRGHRQIGTADSTICEVWSGGAASLEEADRIECLIATAPELLNALRGLIAIAVWDEDSDHDEFDAAMRAADAAVAKATTP